MINEHDKPVFFGVIYYFANQLNWNLTLLRILAVVLLVTYPTEALILYFLFTLFIPTQTS